MKIQTSKKFVRLANKLVKANPLLDPKIELSLERLKHNPYEPSLKTHKLISKFDGILACKVTEDIRILFEIIEDENDELCIHLLSVGKHDEVY